MNNAMTALLFDVEGRPIAFYRQVSVARGERLIHLAGQVGSDETGSWSPAAWPRRPSGRCSTSGSALEAAAATEDD